MNTKYELLLAITKQSLESLLRILKKAEDHIKEKGVLESDILNARLYPDMMNFTKQIQISSDYARKDLAQLSGKEPIAMEDNETTISELKDRVEKSLEIVKTFSVNDFQNADNAKVSFAWMNGSYFTGEDFLNQFAITNMLFHVVTAYDILRAQGVNIGKADFIGEIKMHKAD